MTGDVLTGRAGTEALKLYMGIGASGAHFDRRKVAYAMQSQVGRMKVLGALRGALRKLRKPPAVEPAPTPEKAPETARRGPRSTPTDVGSGGKKKPRLGEGR